MWCVDILGNRTLMSGSLQSFFLSLLSSYILAYGSVPFSPLPCLRAKWTSLPGCFRISCSVAPDSARALPLVTGRRAGGGVGLPHLAVPSSCIVKPQPERGSRAETTHHASGVVSVCFESSLLRVSAGGVELRLGTYCQRELPFFHI